jgi:hypothetical protein
LCREIGRKLDPDDLDLRHRLHRLYGAAQTGEGAGSDAQGQWLLAIKGWLEAK